MILDNNYGGSTPPAAGDGYRESYLQRQRRLQGEQVASTAGTPVSQVNKTPDWKPATGPQITGAPQQQPAAQTPVTGSGKIPEPAPVQPQPQQPQQPAPQAPPPTHNGGAVPPAGVQDPFAAIGGGVYNPATGGWVPKNHPEAAALMLPQAAAPAAQAPAAAATQPPPFNMQTELGTLSSYKAPEHQPANTQQLDIVKKLLSNPETMGVEQTNALKQRSMEEALLYAQQLRQQKADELAARGLDPNGGSAQVNNRRMDEALTKTLLSQGRDIDIQAAIQNRQDVLGALGASEGLLQGQTNREGDIFRNAILGQTTALDNYWRGKQFGLQEKLGVGGLSLDERRINEGSRQFDKGYGLNVLQFLEGQRQHNNNSGFNWAQLNQQGQQGVIATLRGMGLL